MELIKYTKIQIKKNSENLLENLRIGLNFYENQNYSKKTQTSEFHLLSYKFSIILKK